MKRIIICADGTWNRPEQDLKKDFPTNVLKIARAVAPIGDDGVQQVVFYDWGLGSYHDTVKSGAFGAGIDKNIMDDYRFIVQNYNEDDQLYFFGFSRGAYTVRSLAGFMNNCGILKREYANRIEEAYSLYKNKRVHPKDQRSVTFRNKYAVKGGMSRIKFIGVWDTVGALGIPLRVLGFLNERNLFHDNKIGPNIDTARHALSIDEKREDFEPTIWKERENMDLKQVWFAGVHSDVGGGYAPQQKKLLSDIPLKWMIDEASKTDLSFEPHIINNLMDSSLAKKHRVYQGFYKLLGKHERKIEANTFVHQSVKERYEKDPNYRPKPLKEIVANGWSNLSD
jgi:uncharacterized protein (DUF2235 family)